MTSLIPTRRRSAARLAVRGVVLPAVIAIAVGIAGCSSTVAAQPVANTGTSAVTIDNCGFDLTVKTPPKRIITIKSTTNEMLLALGLGDRIIGTAFPDGPVPARWAAQDKNIKVISDFVPSSEAVLNLAPDFIYAGWESNLTAQSAGDRSTLKSLGVGTYVSPSACKEAAFKPKKLSFTDVFGEIRQAGQIFGAQDAATKLVASQKKQLAAITPDTRGLKALWYSSGTDVPYVGAGIGAPQMIMNAVGLTNITASVKDTWTSSSWESIANANPDVIILIDATWNTAASKIAMLEKNPVTSQLTAVRDKRYITIPFASSEAGVRNVAAAADISKQLAALNLP